MWTGALVAAIWTMVIGAVAGVSCSTVGCYLVLRRMSLLGDAISHAVLPGIAIGVLISGQLSGLPVLVGALIAGLATTLLIEALQGEGRLTEDSSMGVVFSSLFSLGVIIIAVAARHKHIDADCLLYGLIETAPLDVVNMFGVDVPRVLTTLVPVLIVVVTLVSALWKELLIASFDEALSSAMGFSAMRIQYILMGMVAAVVVASFEAVGSILVVAMLIVPAATASLLTDRLVRMLLYAAIVSILSSVLGYLGAYAINTSVSGMIAVVGGLQFALAVLFAPQYGIIAKTLRRANLAIRIVGEDILAHLYRTEEALAEGRAKPEAVTIAGSTQWARSLADAHLRRNGWIKRTATGLDELTKSGRKRAEEIVRAHRLWESFLGENFDLPADHLHDAAERMEHFIDPSLQEEIAQELTHTSSDPHGRPIPPADR